MTPEEVEEFRQVVAQLEALHAEMGAATKRGADKALNVFKIRLVNSIIAQAEHMLGEAKPVLGFDGFDEGEMPSASDVSFIVSQYVQCAENVRQANIHKHHDNVWYWKGTSLVTTAPKGAK